jgi:hypothetical protein
MQLSSREVLRLRTFHFLTLTKAELSKMIKVGRNRLSIRYIVMPWDQ